MDRPRSPGETRVTQKAVMEMKRRYLHRVFAALAGAVLVFSVLPGRALATAPLASELPRSDAQVLWHGQSAVVLVKGDKADGRKVIVRDLKSLAFALGYLQASGDPEGLTLLQNQTLAPLDEEELAAVLALWPAEAQLVLDHLADGLNRGLSVTHPSGQQGETGKWDAAAVVRLAVNQSLWQAGEETGENPILSDVHPAGPVSDWPSSTELTDWAQRLFTVRPVLQEVRQHGEFAWAELEETSSGALRCRLPGRDWEIASWQEPSGRWITSSGPLVWADEARTLGLVYRTEAWLEGLARLEDTLTSWFAQP